MVPDDDFKVQEGDRVFVMSMPEVVSKVKKLFVVDLALFLCISLLFYPIFS